LINFKKMSYVIQKTLPVATDIIQEFPISIDIEQSVKNHRQEIRNILEGKDSRKLLIVGPCSAWPSEAVIEYTKKMQPINEKVKDKIKIIIRIYTQKPRTTIGWTGPFNHPNPFDQPDIEEGIKYVRKMMIEVAKQNFPMADEALFTHNDGYVVDLLSWIAIGARSTEDQEHRIFASMIPHPVGIKNPTSGNIRIGINSLIAAQHSHIFAINGKQVNTSGNLHTHIILRGGGGKTNFQLEKIQKTYDLLIKNNIKNPGIIVDASHDNSLDNTGKKDENLQPKVIFDVLNNIKDKPKLFDTVKGFMVESFLQPGNQNLNKAQKFEDLEFGVSVTDPCLDFEKTKDMIFDLHKEL